LPIVDCGIEKVSLPNFAMNPSHFAIFLLPR